MAKLNEVGIPETREITWTFLLSNDGTDNGETFQCAQGTNQVSCYSFDTMEIVELLKMIIQWLLHYH